ncbi:MAG: carbohydrate ABC transporter permease [Bacilli bacterium]|nr:carbohydrate ABC transporter permease [Bacilli bacterium]MBR1582068.1 carbohydrate ABC transporter permease [Bacilli bacterium]
MTIDKKKSKIINKRVADVFTYIGLVIYALVILVPFYIILVTSFKTNSEAVTIPFTWFPQTFNFKGYHTVLFDDASGGAIGVSTVLLGFGNTLLTVLPTTLIGLLTSALAAYAFAKLRFPGKNIMFGILLASMMIPGIVTLMPSYLIYDTLYLTNTFFPIMVPGLFGGAACIFFLRQYFSAIPDDLIEAAKVDGVSYIGIFFKIIVPLSVAALIAQGILWFLNGYNDYLGPYLYLWDADKYTLQIALMFSVGLYDTDWSAVMAGCVIALLPMLILYLFAQRYFIEGIATTGLKI